MKPRLLGFAPVFMSMVMLASITPPFSRVMAQEGQRGGYVIRKDVNLVVLPTTVLDKNGKFVTDLPAESFSVFENKILQKLAIAKHEDIPVSVGLVIDNSGSMRDKRDSVNAAALAFVESSNPYDETFVVNFSDEFFLDQEFTSSVSELEEALGNVTGRGNTAVYDAIVGSMDYLMENGKRDKKALLVVTDGEDHASKLTLRKTIAEIQKSNAIIYVVGVLGEEDRGAARAAKRAIQEIVDASGGLAFFPNNNPVDIEEVCNIIAHDIRNQYTIGYYSSVSSADQSFRRVEIRVKDPKKRDLDVRTRTGYFPKQVPVKK
ncbi:MAG: hypothetical protein A2945_01690 [Candidatus Liptonbacteria bacterium RIFCSPLOWO2_01_FULL_52_25]|uniref:VWFA domain-containing protein n=1 Tax=Candidatus Liptonbacteria bacterium RIFCSPLOWO2_01_FULL_52_25 TaxID=1798650 RepID=A0A1G2CFY7_9BACT|nr:MAG: hypothetical protein A2945_01690 [Candidatus Liptonbacteria bacterium RIFCSPLOWO2_01_FULL_52_25]